MRCAYFSLIWKLKIPLPWLSMKQQLHGSVKISCSIVDSEVYRKKTAVSMIVNGFCKEVFKELPMEFAVEAQKLLGISLEGSVG